MIRFLTAMALVASPVPALAQSADTVSATVRVADLDLSSRSGRAMLDRRIERAAIDVCGTASSSDLEGQNDVAECRDAAVAAAHRQVADRIAARSKMPLRLAIR